MTQRTSKMLRIPGALVPAVRELTLAWHWRERQVGRGRGPAIGAPVDDIAAADDAPADRRAELLAMLRARQAETVERLRAELEAAEQELADTELKIVGL